MRNQVSDLVSMRDNLDVAGKQRVNGTSSRASGLKGGLLTALPAGLCAACGSRRSVGLYLPQISRPRWPDL